MFTLLSSIQGKLFDKRFLTSKTDKITKIFLNNNLMLISIYLLRYSSNVKIYKYINAYGFVIDLDFRIILIILLSCIFWKLATLHSQVIVWKTAARRFYRITDFVFHNTKKVMQVFNMWGWVNDDRMFISGSTIPLRATTVLYINLSLMITKMKRL